MMTPEIKTQSWFVACIVAIAVATPAWADQDETHIESAAGQGVTDVASGNDATSPDDLPPVNKVHAIERGLRLLDHEKLAYERSIERRDNVDMPVALMFISRLKVAPTLDDDEWTQLDAPAIGNLLRKPERYAAVPMRIKVHVARVLTRRPNEHFVPNVYWPASNGPVWQWDCLLSVDGKPTNQALTVLTHIDPEKILGKPASRDQDGDATYDWTSTAVEVAGVFYKVVDGKTIEHKPYTYPVALAWQIRQEDISTKKPAGNKSTQAMLIVVLALAMGFIIIKRQMTLKKRDDEAAAGRRWRAIPRDEQAVDDDVLEDPESIDPELRAAAEDYRRRKEDVDEREDQG